MTDTSDLLRRIQGATDESEGYRIARMGDYWKDYPSAVVCSKCGQRIRAAMIDIRLLAERIDTAIALAQSTPAQADNPTEIT